jgi:L-ascorbate metabolism protein UlaG (beta-lactamase superfamily)
VPLRLAVALALSVAAAPVAASDCLQVAGLWPERGRGPALAPATLAVAEGEVGITFVGHASFRIETAEGVTAVTDFAGWWGDGDVPEIVTMNKAHETHWTASPDPRIAHVLRGWDDASPVGAQHWLALGDLLVRNVPTDIRRSGGVEPFGNSIFVFESAGLCIGHLGHLHHLPTDAHYGLIGRLDIVMVPVDGGYTMNQAAMIEVMKRLRASVVIPMHWFGRANLERFLAGMGGEFAIERAGSASAVFARDRLPARPTVVVLEGF